MTTLGKWSQAGVPHRGWSCVSMEDLGEPSEICEMCESQEIRYVHIMSHPEFHEELRCGVVCAGHMAEALSAAREREKEFKKHVRRVHRERRRAAERRERAEAERRRIEAERQWRVAADNKKGREACRQLLIP
jgi:hypothetical protein